jgi:hypothetical protein
MDSAGVWQGALSGICEHIDEIPGFKEDDKCIITYISF